MVAMAGRMARERVDLVKVLRRFGIAIGSLVAAWLCVWLVGGWLFGSTGGGAIATIAAVLLGGLIFRDILRREGLQG
jgi:hypothetical protein